MTPDPDLRLGQTGSVYVTGGAALSYARAAGIAHDGTPPEQARRELTVLLLSARRLVDAGPEPPERWRHRSRSSGWDIGAQVSREDGLAVVVHVHCRRTLDRAPRARSPEGPQDGR